MSQDPACVLNTSPRHDAWEARQPSHQDPCSAVLALLRELGVRIVSEGQRVAEKPVVALPAALAPEPPRSTSPSKTGRPPLQSSNDHPFSLDASVEPDVSSQPRPQVLHTPGSPTIIAKDLARALREAPGDTLVAFAADSMRLLCASVGIVVEAASPWSPSSPVDCGLVVTTSATIPNEGDSAGVAEAELELSSLLPTYNGVRNLLASALRSPEQSMNTVGGVASLLGSHTPVQISRQPTTTQEDGFTMINEYLLLDKIGIGQFGEVFVAANTAAEDSLVAIKTMPRKKMDKRLMQSFSVSQSRRQSTELDQILKQLDSKDDNPVLSGDPSTPIEALPPLDSNNAAKNADVELLREVAVMKKIKHKSVVRLYEVIDDPAEAKVYLVMQYIERGPLLQFDDKQRCTALDAEMAVTYMRQLLDALQYLHDKKIVHSDIKPDNILLGNNGRAYLADFGVSSLVKNRRVVSTAQGEKLMIHGGDGTPAFMAPEVIGGAASYDGAAADIWALGVTFFTMIFGELPFAGETFMDLKKSVSDEEPRLMGKPVRGSSSGHNLLREFLLEIIRRMLSKDPTKRPSAKKLYDVFNGTVTRSTSIKSDDTRLLMSLEALDTDSASDGHRESFLSPLELFATQRFPEGPEEITSPENSPTTPSHALPVGARRSVEATSDEFRDLRGRFASGARARGSISSGAIGRRKSVSYFVEKEM